eukprot:1152418-Pelagomonas_calceolata.AAC.2
MCPAVLRAAPEATKTWKSRVDGRLVNSGQELPVKIKTSAATASHGPLTLQGYSAVLFERLAKVSTSGQGLGWETGKPRGSHPMNGALPKRGNPPEESGKASKLTY